MRIFLIGFMGAGKTTAGRVLAWQLGADFLDLDGWIEQEKGRSIPQIFKEKGEEHFRKLEAEYLRKTLEHENVVIATGGGTPCFYKNLDWMKNHGLTIYLKLPQELLLRRLQGEVYQRPLLEGANEESLPELINELLLKRAPYYEKAHFTFEIVSENNDFIDSLIAQIKKYFAGKNLH